jgi:hypothetical protein
MDQQQMRTLSVGLAILMIVVSTSITTCVLLELTTDMTCNGKNYWGWIHGG